MPCDCYLLLDPPAAGPWNMAVDEALLEWSAAQGYCCWRFYGWDAPTVSLGYFQTYADRGTHAPSRACPAVRRLTGGGAIVHDAELTYSLVVPAVHPLAKGRDRLYEVVHRSLIETLRQWNIAAALCDEPVNEAAFLCFQRRSPGDVLVGPSKIAGSAQRRRRGAVLQHGSVILRASPAAPELPGLVDLVRRDLPGNELAEAWLAVLAERLGFRWQWQGLSGDLNDRVAELASGCYATDGWTVERRRS